MPLLFTNELAEQELGRRPMAENDPIRVTPLSEPTNILQKKFWEQYATQAEQMEGQSAELQALNADLMRKKHDLETANQRLELMAVTDGLTGAFNHRHFHERLHAEFGDDKNVDVQIGEFQRAAPKIGQIGLQAKSVIAVGSGKGGVGKSTVSTAVALGLKRAGCRVGLCDADVYGPSVPTLLGLEGQPEQAENRIQPIDFEGMPVMSIGFMVPPDQARRRTLRHTERPPRTPQPGRRPRLRRQARRATAGLRDVEGRDGRLGADPGDRTHQATLAARRHPAGDGARGDPVRR